MYKLRELIDSALSLKRNLKKGGKAMKLGKRKAAFHSLIVARGCACYTMCSCKNREVLQSFYNIQTMITEYTSGGI